MKYEIKNMEASIDEYEFAKRLEALNIDYEFQPHSIEVSPPFQGQLKDNHKATIYTPDFAFDYKGHHFVIEIKGFMKGDNRLKLKLADYVYSEQLRDQKLNFYVLRLTGSIKQETKGFYKYNGGKVKQVQNPKQTLKREFFNMLINNLDNLIYFDKESK